MKILRLTACLGAILTPLLSWSTGTAPLTVDFVDLERYSGRWYEIARIPNRFQRHCIANTTADYRVLPDGDMEVINRCRDGKGRTDEARGIARSADPDTRARLEVSFVSLFGWRLFWGDYWILHLGPDYDYALVGHPERRYGWILSRTPMLSPDTRERINRHLLDAGYVPALFEDTPQAGTP